MIAVVAVVVAAVAVAGLPKKRMAFVYGSGLVTQVLFESFWLDYNTLRHGVSQKVSEKRKEQEDVRINKKAAALISCDFFLCYGAISYRGLPFGLGGL